MNKTTTPKLATSVILLRQSGTKSFEVFFTRRPDSMPVLAGMYCYPGGTLRKEDCSAAMIERSVGLDGEKARKIIGAQFRPNEAIGLWIGGVRELFEEAGILLALKESGARLMMNFEYAARSGEQHRALLNRGIDFLGLLKGEHLRADLSTLAYFSHWQTPEQVAARFDTYFFLAVMPEDQSPLATSTEVAHSLWLTPDRALRLLDRGELPMIFPTFASLRTLADFDSLDSVMKEYFKIPR